MPPLRRLHGPERAIMALRRGGDVEGIAGHPVPSDLGIYLGAALLRVLVFFQHQDTRSLAHHETVPVFVPGAGRLGRTIVESGGQRA